MADGQLSTPSLTRAIASGDTKAFAMFYERWFDIVLGLTSRHSRRDEAFCLDVVQDVFVKAIRRMPELRDDAAVHAWLRTVVRSCAADRIRRERALARLHLVHQSDRTADGAPTDSCATAEQLDRLQTAMRAIDESHRLAFLLRYRFGRTLAQIGAVLGLSPGAVDGRLGRAMAAIRRASEADDA